MNHIKSFFGHAFNILVLTLAAIGIVYGCVWIVGTIVSMPIIYQPVAIIFVLVSGVYSFITLSAYKG